MDKKILYRAIQIWRHDCRKLGRLETGLTGCEDCTEVGFCDPSHEDLKKLIRKYADKEK